jgi:hypothetical protein
MTGDGYAVGVVVTAVGEKRENGAASADEEDAGHDECENEVPISPMVHDSII